MAFYLIKWPVTLAEISVSGESIHSLICDISLRWITLTCTAVVVMQEELAFHQMDFSCNNF